MSIIAPISDAEILSAVIAPSRPDFDRAAAESILKLGFSDEQKQRMHDLAEKNNQGVISSLEREELEGYVRVGSFLNLVKAKAQNSLASNRE